MFDGVEEVVGGHSSGSMFETYHPIVQERLALPSPLIIEANYVINGDQLVLAASVQVDQPVTTTDNYVEFVIARDGLQGQHNMGLLMLDPEPLALTDPERLAKVDALKPLADEMGATLAQFSLAWCLQNPRVSTVMTGASRVGQVSENLKALEFVDRFTPELMRRIDEIFA